MKISELIRRLVTDYELPPEEINHGYCADVATVIQEQVCAARIVSDEDFGREYTHTFLRLDDRYYDVEVPEGVDDWRNLPIFARQEQEKAP